MRYALLTFVVGLVLLAIIGAVLSKAVPPRKEDTVDPDLKDRIGRMSDLSKLLAGGLTVASAVFAFVTSRSGGGGRILTNAADHMYVGIALAALSVVFAFAALTVLAASPTRWVVGGWLLITVCSISLFISAIGALLLASDRAADEFERPGVSASLVGATVSFEATLPLLHANETLTVTVYGYPEGADALIVPEGLPGESRGSELYRSRTGPAADGTATVKGSIPITAESYEVIEVRAYRNERDGNCFDNGGNNPNLPTSCVELWLTPRPPQVVTAD